MDLICLWGFVQILNVSALRPLRLCGESGFFTSESHYWLRKIESFELYGARFYTDGFVLELINQI